MQCEGKTHANDSSTSWTKISSSVDLQREATEEQILNRQHARQSTRSNCDNVSTAKQERLLSSFKAASGTGARSAWRNGSQMRLER